MQINDPGSLDPQVALPRPARAGALFRCAASSLVAVAVEFVLLLLFVQGFGMNYLAGAALSTAVYLVVTFALNRRWAFRAHHVPALGQLLKHFAVAGVGAIIALAQLKFFVGTVGLPYQLGWVAAGCINFGAWTFPMSRFFTFAPVETRESSAP